MCKSICIYIIIEAYLYYYSLTLNMYVHISINTLNFFYKVIDNTWLEYKLLILYIHTIIYETVY
jgi:hypothetical protein